MCTDKQQNSVEVSQQTATTVITAHITATQPGEKKKKKPFLTLSSHHRNNPTGQGGMVIVQVARMNT